VLTLPKVPLVEITGVTFDVVTKVPLITKLASFVVLVL
jgi:hypothetical protein